MYKGIILNLYLINNTGQYLIKSTVSRLEWCLFIISDDKMTERLTKISWHKKIMCLVMYISKDDVN